MRSAPGVAGAASGTPLYLRLPRLPAARAAEFLEHALRCGVRLYDSRAYHLRPPRQAALICGYTTVAPGEIAAGVERLQRAWRSFAGRR